MKPTLLLALSIGAALTVSAGPSAYSAPQAGTPTAAPDDAKSFPDQSTVAAKKTFPSAPAAAAKDALGAKDMAGAQKLIDKPGAFQGTVTTVYSPKSHGIVILDFDRNYREALTVIVRPADYAKLPDLATLKGKHVLVSGKFETYKDKPEIEVSDPSQIKLLP